MSQCIILKTTNKAYNPNSRNDTCAGHFPNSVNALYVDHFLFNFTIFVMFKMNGYVVCFVLLFGGL